MGGLLPHARKPARASRPRARSRARSSPTTTSTTPTPPSNASPSSTRPHRPPASSSSTPTPAASPPAARCWRPMSARCACDPVSAFGGIVALNRRLDAEAARKIVEIFTEVIIAPDADEEAIALIAAKKNLRLLLTGGLPDAAQRRAVAAHRLRRLPGPGPRQRRRRRHGAQGRDQARSRASAELADLRFAFRVAKHVKSNAIVYAKDGATVGIGAGQMSRVDSSRIAAWKASGSRQGRRPGRDPGQGLGRRLRRLLPLRRRPAGRGRGRRDRRHPARRLDARRRGDQGRRRGRPRHGLHRPPPFPALRTEAMGALKLIGAGFALLGLLLVLAPRLKRGPRRSRSASPSGCSCRSGCSPALVNLWIGLNRAGATLAAGDAAVARRSSACRRWRPAADPLRHGSAP